jgi:hypothetical protein
MALLSHGISQDEPVGFVWELLFLVCLRGDPDSLERICGKNLLSN